MSDLEFQSFKKLLRDNEYFVTKARLRLYAILHHHPEVSTKQLVELANENDQATIYRNLNLFEQLGIINRLRLGWHSKVELSDMFQHHHHHFTCLRCGAVTTLPENQALEREIERLANSQHFSPTDHQLEIRGTCKPCQSKLNEQHLLQ